MISIDGERLSTADIVAAAHRRDTVVLDDQARLSAARSHDFAERISAERPVYGRSTGVGANRTVTVSADGTGGRQLLRSHATSAGPLRAPERVRAMLVVRLNQLAAGGSGASPALLDGLVTMLAADALPHIREHGSIGTGDLPALATAALALVGEAPTTNPLPSLVEFGRYDALPFLSSNAAAIADAGLAGVELETLARASVVVAGLTFIAIGGNREAFSEAVERVTPFDGARRVCCWMRLLTTDGAPPARIQDPFGLRTLPQTHGPLLDALVQLDTVVCRLANAPSENPVLLPQPDGTGQLAHHGGFHAAYLATSLQTVTITAAQSATLVLARLASLVDPAFTGLPPFLGDGTAGASGVMMLEYVAASALAEIRAAAAPSGVQTVVLSRGVEEDASFASLAARQVAAAATSLRIVLACELVAAMRAVRARAIPPAGELAERVYAICADLPAGLADRDLTGDVELAQQLLPALGELL